MNTNKTIINTRPIGGNYFRLIYERKYKTILGDFIDKFKFDDYWCFKLTNKQRLINYEDFLKFEYSGYIFFKKDKYNKDNIQEWIDWSIKVFSGHGPQYLNNPTPPFNNKKIIIKL